MTWQGVILGLLCGMIVTCLIIGAILYDRKKEKVAGSKQNDSSEEENEEAIKEIQADEEQISEEETQAEKEKRRESLLAKITPTLQKAREQKEAEENRKGEKTVYICDRNHGWGQRIILLLILLLFALFDYKIILFDQGFKTILSPAPEIAEDIVSGLAYIDDIKETYFVQLNDDHYIIVMNTGSHGLPHQFGNAEDLEDFRAGGLILDQLKPQVVTPVPWWIYLIVFILIIGIPAPRYKIEKIT